MFGELNDEEIEQLLNKQFVGRIGCTANNMVYVVPIGYAYDGTYLYGHSKEGLKLKIMRENPQVCFEVDDISDIANWQSVIGWGTFEELTEGNERKEGIQKIVAKNLPPSASQTSKLLPEYPFFSDDKNDVEGVVYRIRLEKKTGRFEKFSAAIVPAHSSL